MTINEILLALAALGAVITTLATARNSVTKAQLEKFEKESAAKLAKSKQESDARLAEQKAESDALANEQRLRNEEQDRHNRLVDADFERLHKEIARLEVSNTNRAVENERLSVSLETMRQVGEKRDGEIIVLRQELAAERLTKAQLTQRITELEAQVKTLTEERDTLRAAKSKAEPVRVEVVNPEPLPVDVVAKPENK